MMFYLLSYQQYKYEYGVPADEQRAADVRAGEFAAELRDLRLRFGRAFRLRHRVRPVRRATVDATVSAQILSGVR